MNRLDILLGVVSVPFCYPKIKKWEDYTEEERAQYLKEERQQKTKESISKTKECLLFVFTFTIIMYPLYEIAFSLIKT